MGALRQLLFSCLTCNPPPESPTEEYKPAGVCYSCSISCHGEHTLVELFTKRNFVCDCGTTRIPETSPCTLRVNEVTGEKGEVHSEPAAKDNKYNHNFRNRFCGCGENYDAHSEKGTMFQCMGLGTSQDGGCGEDWWHAECIVGLPRGWYKDASAKTETETKEETTEPHNPITSIHGDAAALSTAAPTGETDVPLTGQDAEMHDQFDEDPPLPPGFPKEDDFDTFICYKCADAFPWIKRYASTEGFLPAVHYRKEPETEAPSTEGAEPDTTGKDITSVAATSHPAPIATESRKRKASEEPTEIPIKRQRSSSNPSVTGTTDDTTPCRYNNLPQPPVGKLSLFLTDDFRPHLCRCPTHFPLLTPHPVLLDEEEVYELPVSDGGSSHGDGTGNGSLGTRSLLDRGEAALSNVDRVRAIEGVMVYNHLKDKVKGFLKPFADSGVPVGAEDIKAYFEGLRGDAEAIKAIRQNQTAGAGGDGGEKDKDGRREQGGY